MAYYFLRVSILTRGKRNSVTRAAAYRAGERIRDAETGATHDHTHRDDIAAAEIVLPSTMDDNPKMEWARDRATLWNAVQFAGTRSNARLAREILVVLPPELSEKQRVNLTRQVACELADKYGCAVDFACHRPRPHADDRHHHAHILMSCRKVTESGMGARTALELSGSERQEQGLGESKADLLWLRARWAELSNTALYRAGIEARIDHRSYRDQGIDREPKPHMPKSVTYAEKGMGRPTAAGDRIRRDYRARVMARARGPEEYERVVKLQRDEASQRIAEQRGRSDIRRPSTREEINQRRREFYEANKAKISQTRREHRSARRDEINRLKREENRANRDDYNRQQRERYQRRQAAKGKTVREISRDKTAVDSAQEWLKYKSQKPAKDLADSVNKWRRYRDQGSAEKSGLPGQRPQAETAARSSSKTKDDHSL